MSKYSKEQIKQMIKIIKEELDTLEEYDINIIKSYPRITIHRNILNAVFFDEFDSPNFSVEEMRKLDLSEIDFSFKDMTNKDYSFTNINLDPQLVIDKSLFNTNLKCVDLFGKDFTDVDIRKANLSDTGALIVLTTIKNIDEYTELDGCRVIGNIDPIEEIKETFKIYRKEIL